LKAEGICVKLTVWHWIKDMAVLGAVRGYEEWLKRSEEPVSEEGSEVEKSEAEEVFTDEDLKALEEADPLILMEDLGDGHHNKEGGGTSGLSKAFFAPPLFLFCCC
jgi:hypothetical protein